MVPEEPKDNGEPEPQSSAPAPPAATPEQAPAEPNRFPTREEAEAQYGAWADSLLQKGRP